MNRETILLLLIDINSVWNREGFGSDDHEMEPIKARLEDAIRGLGGLDDDDDSDCSPAGPFHL